MAAPSGFGRCHPIKVAAYRDVWVEEFPTEFAPRYVCLYRVRWPSQLRNSDMPSAIQTNSSSGRRG